MRSFGRNGGRVRQRNRRLDRLLEDVGRQHLPAGVLAVVHERDEPVREILDVRNDCSAGRDAVGVFVIRNVIELERVTPLRVADAVLGLFHHLGNRVAGRSHVERLEDAFADELLPRLARLELDHVADAREHQVVVEERLAYRFLRLEILQTIEQFFA